MSEIVTVEKARELLEKPIARMTMTDSRDLRDLIEEALAAREAVIRCAGCESALIWNRTKSGFEVFHNCGNFHKANERVAELTAALATAQKEVAELRERQSWIIKQVRASANKTGDVEDFAITGCNGLFDAPASHSVVSWMTSAGYVEFTGETEIEAIDAARGSGKAIGEKNA